MNKQSQNLTSELPEELQPCHHMVSLVSRRADDTLTGPGKWYTDFHVMTCPHCRVALKGLRDLKAEVTDLAAAPADPELKLSDEQWKATEEEIQRNATSPA